MIRTLIVDDVPLARDKLRHLLAAHADIDIRGEAADVEQARHLLQHQTVDLLLLDIQMPGQDGMQLAQRLPAPAPLVIFTTAHARHAVDSYALGAVDYLLKPLDGMRLALALERVRRQLVQPPPSTPQPLCIRNGAGIEYIPVGDIDYIDNAGHYACVHVGRQVHLLRESIGRLAQQLAPAGFLQVQRAVIVNLARVRSLQHRRNGDATLLLLDGTALPLSRSHRDAFDQAIAQRG